MKKVTEKSEKELAYTSPMDFVEQILTDKYVSVGEIKSDMASSTFKGEINLNTFTSELQRYLSAKVSYSKSVGTK